jgi:hypothetical protein
MRRALRKQNTCKNIKYTCRREQNAIKAFKAIKDTYIFSAACSLNKPDRLFYILYLIESALLTAESMNDPSTGTGR